MWNSPVRCTMSRRRGDGREDIYRADADRGCFLESLAGVWARYHGTVHAYCLMSDYYHLLVATPEANLAKGMRQLNGVCTQRVNRRYHGVIPVPTSRRVTVIPAWSAGIQRPGRVITIRAGARYHRQCRRSHTGILPRPAPRGGHRLAAGVRGVAPEWGDVVRSRCHRGACYE